MSTLTLDLAERQVIVALIERLTIGDLTNFRQARTVRQSLRLNEVAKDVEELLKASAEANQGNVSWDDLRTDAETFEMPTDALRWLNDRMVSLDWTKARDPQRPVPPLSLGQMAAIADCADKLAEALGKK